MKAGLVAALLGLSVLMVGAASAQNLVFRFRVPGLDGVAHGAPGAGAPSAPVLDTSAVVTPVIARNPWSGSMALDPSEATLSLIGSFDDGTGAIPVVFSGDDGDGLLEPDETWSASLGGLVLGRINGTVALSGDAVGGEYSLDLTADGSASPTRLSLHAVELDKLTAADAAAVDQFGTSIALAGDTALIGAPHDDGHGSAYVFVRVGASWIQQAKLTAADAEAGDEFGGAVALFGDTALIGASRDGTTGSAYVFIRSGTDWNIQQKLTASDGLNDGFQFGHSVAVSGDTALIGAYGDPYLGAWTGSAYVFTRSAGTWSPQAKLTATDAAAGDNFAWSVAVAGDTVLIGAHHDDDHGSNSGSAYVFTRSGITWNQQAKLTADDAVGGSYFGRSVALSGETALVGANGRGRAYVFTRTDDSWSQQAALAGISNFGLSVALAGDRAVIGAPYSESYAGRSYLFTRSGSSWTQQALLTAVDAAVDDHLGWSVAISHDDVIIGATGTDDNGSASGSVYFLPRSP